MPLHISACGIVSHHPVIRKQFACLVIALGVVSWAYGVVFWIWLFSR
jgi:hypothetical protein